MTLSILNLKISNPSAAKYADLGDKSTSVVTLKDFATGANLAWTANYRTGSLNESGGTGGSTIATVGDAAFIDDINVVRDGHAMTTVGAWAVIDFKNLDDAKNYRIKAMSSDDSADRITDWRVNGGGTVLSLNNYDSVNARPNNSEIVLFDNVISTGGVLSVEYTTAAASSNTAYASLIAIEELASPSLTVTQTNLTPGGTISGTYANYATIPTTLTVSDGTNTITIPAPSIVDNGTGGGTFSGTMPALPTTGTASLVLFGDVTVELS